MDVFLKEGSAVVPLHDCWFESGLQGSMGELLSALEEDRAPNHSARNNLKTLDLCFNAIKSADNGIPVHFE